MPAVNLITALPTFVSQEEHRALVASTPTSFNDIPPVLRHQEDNVSVKLDPAIEGFTDEDGAKGTLLVLTRYFLPLHGRKLRLIRCNKCSRFHVHRRTRFPDRVSCNYIARDISGRKWPFDLLSA